MQQYLSGSSLFVHALMQRQVDGRLLLVVEGEDEDTILVGHLNDVDVALLMAGGKPAVLEAAGLVHQQNLPGVRALVDRDLDDVTGKSSQYPHDLLVTAGYDFATDLIISRPELLERTCRAHGKQAVGTHADSFGVALTESAFELTLALAAVRLVNEEQALMLNLRDFPFSSLDPSAVAGSPFTEILRIAEGRSKAKPDREAVLRDIPQAISRLNGDRRHCGGHDLMRAAAALLRWSGEKKASPVAMEASLYTATDCLAVKGLAFVVALQAWAASLSKTALSC